MSIPVMIVIAMMALGFMAWMLLRARHRVRAASRLAMLQGIVDPARGGVPLVHGGEVRDDDVGV